MPDRVTSIIRFARLKNLLVQIIKTEDFLVHVCVVFGVVVVFCVLFGVVFMLVFVSFWYESVIPVKSTL